MLSSNIYVNKKVFFAGKKIVMFSNMLNKENDVSRKQNFRQVIPLKAVCIMKLRNNF